MSRIYTEYTRNWRNVLYENGPFGYGPVCHAICEHGATARECVCMLTAYATDICAMLYGRVDNDIILFIAEVNFT